MRDLKRSIARAMMESQGIPRINKKRPVQKGDKVEYKSFFAQHWREFLDPNSKWNKRSKAMKRRKKVFA